MKWYTHVLFSIVLLKLLGFDPVLIFLGALAALLPDIYITNSPIGRLLLPISRRLSRRYAHRSITHSLPVLTLITAAGSILGFDVSLALAIGYMSHIILDMLNPSGAPLLYPKPSQFVLLGGSVSVGETGEKTLAAVLTITIIVLACFDMLGTDPASFFGALIASDSWVSQWEILGQDCVVEATVYGYWAYSRVYVEITGNVTGAEGSVLYVESGGNVYSVSNREGSSIIASKVELVPTEIWTEETVQEPKDYFSYADFLEDMNNIILLSGKIHFYNRISGEQKFDIEQAQMSRPESHIPIMVVDESTLEFRNAPLDFFRKIFCCVPDGEIKTGPIAVKVIA